jgi:hypothetical protein
VIVTVDLFNLGSGCTASISVKPISKKICVTEVIGENILK